MQSYHCHLPRLPCRPELCNPVSFMDASCLLCHAISSMLTVLINANMSAYDGCYSTSGQRSPLYQPATFICFPPQSCFLLTLSGLLLDAHSIMLLTRPVTLLTQALAYTLTNTHPHSLTHSLNQSLTHSLTQSLTL